ncbi:MAG: methyltransferase domain-containing protein [Saprospiraceae bacterium]|nr:methyltransferase domain-containing protein [Saprospiraceae bacterium]
MGKPVEPEYAEYITAYNTFMQPALQDAINEFGPLNGSCGLDAGCGPGDQFDAFAKKVGVNGKVIATDLSTVHLKEAKERSTTLPSIEVIMSSLDLTKPLPFDNNAFDWVWCADVLWSSWFENPQQVIDEFARVCRPNGKVGLFYNGWQRTQLLSGHRHLEFELVRVSDTILRPALSSDPKVDIEYMAGWLRQAGLKKVNVTTHTVTYNWPLPPNAKPYVDCVLEEDYLPALDVTKFSKEKKEKLKCLLTPGHPDYIPDQPHYFCCKTGILAVGEL